MKKLLLALALALTPAAAFAANVGLPALDNHFSAQSLSLGSDGNPNIGTATDSVCPSTSSACTVVSIDKQVMSLLMPGGNAVSSSNPWPSADAIADAGIGTPADAACGSCASGSLVAILKQWLVAAAGSIPTGTNTIGSVILAPTTTPGLSLFHYTSTAGVNPTLVKGGSIGAIFWLYLDDTATYPVTIKFYNSHTPTCDGTQTPLYSFTAEPNAPGAVALPAGGLPGGGGNTSFCITKLPADTDATAVAAGDLILNIAFE